MSITIRLRRATAAEWTAANPTLALGEMGLETDTQRLKVGDGVTVWADLDYWYYSITELDALLAGKSNDDHTHPALAGRTLADYAVAELDSDFSTTSTSFQDVLSLTTPTLQSGDLLEIAAAGVFFSSRSAATTRANFNLEINGDNYTMPQLRMTSGGANSVDISRNISRSMILSGYTGSISVKFQARTHFGDNLYCSPNSFPDVYFCQIIAKVWR